MINRTMHALVLEYATQFPVVAIVGPRQSGKTTLAQKAFSEYRYYSLENPDTRFFAQQDPRGFLESLLSEKGVIIDEFQHVPELLSYIQGIVDARQQLGFFVLTGSQNFLMNEKISQTLAGRIGIVTLLPLSVTELVDSHHMPEQLTTLLFQGSYPRIYVQNVPPSRWYSQYVQTYLERDVRLIKNISDLGMFQKFVQLCAGRIGQLLNITALANDCGISVPTARSWITLLEASYIIFLLQPYHANFNKRLVKTPKLFFYDTGLAAYLLGLESVDQLHNHYLKGALFESYVISEAYKQFYNRGLHPHVSFWRDSNGHEVDCIIEKGLRVIPLEVKSGQTFNRHFVDMLESWKAFAQVEKGYVVYGGNETFLQAKTGQVGWRDMPLLFDTIF